MNVRRCPTLPQGPPCSTIGAASLSFRVRNVSGRFPRAMAAETLGPSTLVGVVGGLGDAHRVSAALALVGVWGWGGCVGVEFWWCFRLLGTTEWTQAISGHAHGLYVNEHIFVWV